ncbi:hypothetical protein ABZ816_38370 [Actinosynnema sp. NPDC047251]|uniref:Peptidase C39-like domain-containing protein n=1 Tax=Saccharothrix espanaensis (strain ATCC 51144 / DSM 44229 / JCM 9112 / NBRC 15066 / NRRL 15764) TaxID=1179773 RepID=K0JPW2_SACES|nr:hypothetical protein [Saccharothrix espanaensis]CCH29225.1 hypothetical protein BN6_19050 [Saccharothrix espanaensis DSM 44229]
MATVDMARMVAAQLGVLVTVGALPIPADGVRLSDRPVPVCDETGEVALWRYPAGDGYVDVAARPCLGAPLVAVVPEGRLEPARPVARPTASAAARIANEERYRQRVQDLTHLAQVLKVTEPVVRRFDRGLVEEVLRPRVDTQELRLCGRPFRQETAQWATAACVQVVLDFYRYLYDQERLAEELGLGTEEFPVSGDEHDVAPALETLTGKALTAELTSTPTFAEYRSEVREHRPSISFVPGHARVVTGYTRMSSLRLIGASFAGLLVQDPWDGGARWENYDATTFVGTCTARVNLVP